MRTRKSVAACVVWGVVAGAAWANPNGEPVLERCLVSLKDEARVPAQEAGVIVDLAVREGDKVTAGQVIARLSADQPEMEKRKAAAEFEQAVAKAESDVDVRFAQAAEGVAKRTFDKAEQSHESVKGAVTEVERDRLRLEWQKATLQIEQARLQQRLDKLAASSKQVEVEAADRAVKRREILAPIDGVVEDVSRHQGEWMQPGDALAHVLRTDTLRVEGYVDASKWDPGDIRDRGVTVEVELANGRRETFEGRIAFVSEQVESGGDYRVYADVGNRRGQAAVPGADGEWLLRAGQTARMTIHTQRPPVPR